MQWNTYPLEKHLEYQEHVNKHFVNYLTQMRLNLLELNQDKENLINKVCSRTLILFLVQKYKKYKNKKLTIFIPGSLRKNNRTILLDSLNTLDLQIQNILHILLYRILVQELISKEKVLTYYWTRVYKEISEKLLLPTKTDLVDLDMNLSNYLSKSQEELSESLTKTSINLQNKSYQKTFCQLFTSTVADKWDEEDIKGLKNLKIQLRPTEEQLKLFKEWFDVTRYLYNKALELIKTGSEINFIKLRDKLVTKNTKKDNQEYKDQQSIISSTKDPGQLKIEKEKLRTIAKNLKSSKNDNCKEWTLNVPKEVRANSIRDLCKNFKTVFSNFRNGNINRFSMKYRRKNENNQYLCIQKNLIQLKNNNDIYSIVIPFLGEYKTFELSKSTSEDIKRNGVIIDMDVRLIRKNGKYYLCIPISIENIKPGEYKNGGEPSGLYMLPRH